MNAPSTAKFTDEFAVEFKNVSKIFGSCVANESISFRVQKGTIHGIIGENGAGKSTAMKLLYGLYGPTSGEIFVHGEKRVWKTPQDAIRAGIGMVHQHFMLAEPYSVLDNIVLGAESGNPSRSHFFSAFGSVDRSGARKKIEALSKKYGLEVPLDASVETLPVGIQQRIEILKALYRGAEILILDEPTAVLTPQEVEKLLLNLKSLKSEGKTILIITHKLKEVLAFTDHVTVFRQGRVSGEVATRDASVQSLADLMVGRAVHLVANSEANVPGEAVCEAKHLHVTRDGVEKLKDVALTVRSGEIVGIAGVEGNGQSELIQALVHPKESLDRGDVRVLGNRVTNWKPARILKLGVSLIPEDRHREALLLHRSVEENFILGQQSSYSWYGWLNRRWIKAAVARAMENFDVRPRDPKFPMSGLSGGNQQKVVIAREFERSPKFLIAAQPTRGVDVGAIEFIHAKILKARKDGVGVLLVSSELDEVMQLSDRILVLYGGKVVAEYKRGEATEREIGAFMTGGGKT